jgi:hypothetical protein
MDLPAFFCLSEGVSIVGGFFAHKSVPERFAEKIPPQFLARQQINPAIHSPRNTYAPINLTLTDKTSSGATVQKTVQLTVCVSTGEVLVRKSESPL